MPDSSIEEPYGARKLAYTAIIFAAVLLIGGFGTILYKRVLNPYNSLQENEFGVTVNTPDPFGWVTEVAERAAVTGTVVLIITLAAYFFFWFRAQR